MYSVREKDIEANSDEAAQEIAITYISGGEGLISCIELCSCDTAWSFDYGDCQWSSDCYA